MVFWCSARKLRGSKRTIVVGQTLAGGFLRHGHEVMIGTRSPFGFEVEDKGGVQAARAIEPLRGASPISCTTAGRMHSSS